MIVYLQDDKKWLYNVSNIVYLPGLTMSTDYDQSVDWGILR